MIKHIVCFKLKDKAQKDEVRQKLLSMRGKVADAEHIEVGVDFLMSERSYDVILMVDVKDRAALDRYQSDLYHVQAVKPFMHAVQTASIAVDYEY